MSHVNEERGGIPRALQGRTPFSRKKRISHLICIFITTFFGTHARSSDCNIITVIVFLFVTHLCTLIWQRCYDENGKKEKGSYVNENTPLSQRSSHCVFAKLDEEGLFLGTTLTKYRVVLGFWEYFKFYLQIFWAMRTEKINV